MCVFSVLEVYQFARDAAVAEAWLIAQEPYLMNQELGVSKISPPVIALYNVFIAFSCCLQGHFLAFICLQKLIVFPEDKVQLLYIGCTLDC